MLNFLAQINMKVEIPKMQEHAGYPGNVMLVEINDYCPRCGGKRGEPFSTISYDGSRRLHVSGWTNPCGHVDTYAAVRKEVFRKRNFKHQFQGKIKQCDHYFVPVSVYDQNGDFKCVNCGIKR